MSIPRNSRKIVDFLVTYIWQLQSRKENYAKNVPVHKHHECVWGSEVKGPHILNLSTGCT